MSTMTEGDILEDANGNQFKFEGGQLRPFNPIARNPQTGELVESYQDVFAGAPELTTPQAIAGGLGALSEGSLLGFGGEVAGLMGPEYQQAFDRPRQAFAEQNPVSNIGLEIAGTLINPLTRNIGRTMVASRPVLGSAATGAGFGAAFGAGKAEPGERLMGGLAGGAVGGALGGPMGYGMQLLTNKVIPSAVNLASRAKTALTPQVSSAARQAEDIIRPFMQKAFPGTYEAAQAAAKLGPRGTLMDIAPEISALANVAYDRQLISQNAVKRFFTTRSKQGMARLESSVRRLFGKRAETGNVMQSITDRNTRAGELFDIAKSQVVPEEKMAGFISQIDDQIKLNENTSFAPALNAIKRSLFSGRGKDAALKTSVAELHRARMDLADKASAAFMKGKREQWRMLKDMRNALDDVLPPEYSEAMQLSAQKNQIQSASELGNKFFTTKIGDFLEWVSDATAAEKDAYMMGLLKASKEKMGSVTEGGKVSRFFNTPNVREKLDALIGDPAKTAQFIQSVERENMFKAAENLVMGNSFTSARIEANKLFDSVVGDAMRTVPTSRWDFARGLVDMLKIDKTLSPKVSQALQDQLLKQGVTRHTVEMLMRTPFKERAKEYFINAAPRTGDITARTASDIFPSIRE